MGYATAAGGDLTPDVGMRIDVVAAGRDAIVCLAGELDLASVGELRTRLRGAIAVVDGDVVVDMSGVAFCDLTTLSALMHARLALDARGDRSLRVVEPSPATLRLLELTGVTDLLDARPGAA